jgi:deoxycitidine kinase/deoxyguanosine kinase
LWRAIKIEPFQLEYHGRNIFSDLLCIIESLFSKTMNSQSQIAAVLAAVRGVSSSSSSDSGPKIISLEGNIGAGKSTLLKAIESSLTEEERGVIVCMQEPVDLWESVRDSDGESILKKFYREPAKYAFAFQIMAYTSRLEALKRVLIENTGCRVLVCERSLEADKNIFALMLHDDGLIDSVSYQVYAMLFANTACQYPVDLVLYLDVAPAECLVRVGKRARDGEGGIGLEYLTKCHEYYEAWISGMDSMAVFRV